MWGQPRPINNPIIETVYMQFNADVDSVCFDFAWVVGGDVAPNTLDIVVSEVLGFGEIITVPLLNQFDGGQVFQNATGSSGRVVFTVASLLADYELALSSIRHIGIFVDPISTQGSVGAFAVDNFAAYSATTRPQK